MMFDGLSVIGLGATRHGYVRQRFYACLPACLLLVLGAVSWLSAAEMHPQHAIQRLRLHAPLTSTILAEGGLAKDARVIQAQIFVPDDAPRDLGVGAFIKDDDGTWFQLAHPYRLGPGHHHLHFSLDASTPWSSEPGSMRWSDYRIFNGQHYGLYFWSEQSSQSELTIQSLRAVNALHGETVLTAFRCTDLSITNYDVHTQQAYARTGERWDIYLRPDPFPQNPYDMELFQMDLLVTDAGGQEHRFPCFYKQQIVLRDGGDREIGIATMDAAYCARFRPMHAGVYDLRIEARWYVSAEKAALADTTITGSGTEHETDTQKRVNKSYVERVLDLGTLAVSGDDYDPYLRVDADDKRFFSYGAGEKQFHFPVGLNIQCISDKRAIKNVKSAPTPVRGLLSYKAYLDRLARGGGNSAEIWLSSWNLALEWNDAWPDQHGVGIYSEANAERVEQLLDYAWERGIRIILVINNHGQASAKSDPEWKESPYNKANGGWLERPSEMFTDERARHYQQQIRRYIVGRYADHPAIMCWKMWSEMNLTGGSKTQLVDWHAWAFHDWKAMDHYYQHPVTSHWCGDYRNPDPNLVSLPQMDFIAIDAYHRQGFLPGLLQRSTLDPKRGLSQFNKPIVVTEFGGNWNACPLPQLVAEHHIGAWCALVSGHGSAPHLWWFEWVDQNNLYRPYAGISAFLAGEDLRDPQARSRELNMF